MGAPENAINGMINNALMNMHTAFCGKVLSVSGNTAKVQPLNMIKAKGGAAQAQSVLPSVPILQPSFKAKSYKKGTLIPCGECEVVYELDIRAGDTVYCVCAESSITDAKNGQMGVPIQGRNMLSDAVIVGKF